MTTAQRRLLVVDFGRFATTGQRLQERVEAAGSERLLLGLEPGLPRDGVTRDPRAGGARRAVLRRREASADGAALAPFQRLEGRLLIVLDGTEFFHVVLGASLMAPGHTQVLPLRASKDALAVNWLSVEITNVKGKRTYHNSFVTDLAVTADTVAVIAADCGRARWQIENETFNVLRANGYHLEHNFGRGKSTLPDLFLVLNLLAFAFHTVVLLRVEGRVGRHR